MTLEHNGYSSYDRDKSLSLPRLGDTRREAVPWIPRLITKLLGIPSAITVRVAYFYIKTVMKSTQGPANAAFYNTQ